MDRTTRDHGETPVYREPSSVPPVERLPIVTQEEYGNAYQRGFPSTVRLLRYRGASVDIAEDIAQAAWLRGWQKLDQLRDEGLILRWVNTMATNHYTHLS